ncbi:hypothetical protein NMO_0094 [Neisseria meningitidis alpha14]|uniref:Uncharacterized protein n=1 Tax=Neisseria meningitidis (strain alpha14) TaxID=662598 RepID=C6S4K3_NEIML|nr:hypothetical protein NMO_0094 [Neisseria meningitidis alpha14]
MTTLSAPNRTDVQTRATLFPSGTKPSAMTADPNLSDTMKVCRPESQTSADRLICLFFIVLQKICIYF